MNSNASQIVISVVICVHNGERHLAETLESVLRQTGVLSPTSGSGIEVIIIDDCSIDTSPAIIREFVPRLQERAICVRTVTHATNLSIIQSYHEGTSLAAGKFVKVLDHDDVLASNEALARPVAFMEAMEKNGKMVGAVFSKTLYMDENGQVFGEKRFPFPFLPFEARDGPIAKNWGQFVILFSPLYPFVHGATVMRKEAWQHLSTEQIRLHGSGLFDVLFALHVMHSSRWQVGYLRSPGLRYRIHPTSFTHSAVKRDVWTDILAEHYRRIYGEGVFLRLLTAWTRSIQWLKSTYHRCKGKSAFKSIGAFGRRRPER